MMKNITVSPEEITFNYIKHSSQHPIRRWMIDSFYIKLIEGIKPVNVSTVLDVGAGEGFTLDRLSNAKIGKKLIGVDNSEKAVKLGKRLFSTLDLRTGDIYNLSFSGDSMDLIICTEVLEHLDHPRKALKELIRVSKKYLILSVPNEPFFRLKNLIIGRNVRRLGSTKNHVNHWTSWGFEKFVKEEKVKILSCNHPFPFTLLLVQKYC